MQIRRYAIRLDPKQAAALNNRGVIFYHRKDFDRALAEYTRAIQLAPSFTTALRLRALAPYDTGKLDDALRDLELAAELEPSNADTWLSLGRIRERSVMRHESSAASTDSQSVPQDHRMDKRRSRFAPAVSFVNETLEGRLLLSGIAPALGTASALRHRTVEVAARAVRSAPTSTMLTVNAGTLSQPITFAVTVRSAARAGSPEGTVQIIDHGTVIETLTLSPTTSSNARYAFSDATSTLTQPAGGGAYFFGRHSLSAVFIPSGGFLKSKAAKTFTVSKPAYTPLANGVEIETIAQGSGAEIQSGQTASILYTGYLAKDGHIFDDSINDGGAPFSFTVGAGQVIPGFDEGVVGMQVGETRIVLIPPAEGYGPKANGPIPGNSTLIFVLKLESIS